MSVQYFAVAGSIKSPTLSQLSAVFNEAKPFNFSTISPNEFAIFAVQNFLDIKFRRILSDITRAHQRLQFELFSPSELFNFEFRSHVRIREDFKLVRLNEKNEWNINEIRSCLFLFANRKYEF